MGDRSSGNGAFFIVLHFKWCNAVIRTLQPELLEYLYVVQVQCIMPRTKVCSRAKRLFSLTVLSALVTWYKRF